MHGCRQLHPLRFAVPFVVITIVVDSVVLLEKIISNKNKTAKKETQAIQTSATSLQANQISDSVSHSTRAPLSVVINTRPFALKDAFAG